MKVFIATYNSVIIFIKNTLIIILLMLMVTCMCGCCTRPCAILVPVDRHMGEMSSSTGLSGVDLDGGEAELELEVASCMCI